MRDWVCARYRHIRAYACNVICTNTCHCGDLPNDLSHDHERQQMCHGVPSRGNNIAKHCAGQRLSHFLDTLLCCNLRNYFLRYVCVWFWPVFFEWPQTLPSALHARFSNPSSSVGYGALARLHWHSNSGQWTLKFSQIVYCSFLDTPRYFISLFILHLCPF